MSCPAKSKPRNLELGRLDHEINQKQGQKRKRKGLL